MATSPTSGARRSGVDTFLSGVGWISTVCGWISAAMILASVLITCQMIFVRFVLRESTIWQTETVIYMMIGATMLGLPYVQKLRGHVNVDLLPIWLRPAPRKALAVLVLMVAIGVILMMGWYAYENWHTAWQRGWRSATVWGPKLWVPYILLPLGFALFALQMLADLIALLTGRDKAFGLEDN
jgi:TRAP-type C4-dicarboxylate transport system permease small subunit